MDKFEQRMLAADIRSSNRFRNFWLMVIGILMALIYAQLHRLAELVARLAH